MASIIDRNGANVLIPQPLASEIFQGATDTSAVLKLATRLPDMTARTLSMPVLNSLPMAYFVNGDIGLKQTTNVDWTDKKITAEEIAVIVPVPDAVLADSQFDIWAQIKPLVSQAFGKVIDQAMLYGVGKPNSWPNGIVPDADAKGNGVAAGTGDSLYDDIMGADGIISLVEQDGYMVSGYIGAMNVRGALRNVKTTDGFPIFRAGMTDNTLYKLDGQDIIFPLNGGVDPTKSLLVGGDFKQMVYSIRQDLTMKLLDQSVITNPDGTIAYNLPQQDMVALRFVMRLGWALPNPVNSIGGTDRYPFAVLKPGTP